MKGRLLKSLIRKCSISLLSLTMIVGTLTASSFRVHAATGANLNVETVADANTSTNWVDFFGLTKESNSYNNITSYNNFIQKVGSVYVDKSVSTIKDSDDFNVTFTALQSAFSYSTTQTSKALGVDVVLVLDNSNSMRMSSGASGDSNLLETMVKAADALIQQLLSIENSAIRIAIVTYNSGSTVILEFDEYKQVKITYSSSGIHTVATNASGQEVTGHTGKNSGTNTQAGIYAGMNILANADDTDGRIPVVVVLTDGEANRAVTSTWYNITQGSTTSSTNPVALATLLTGSYMKARIEDNYSASKPYVYGIGLNLDNDARVVVDPKNYFKSDSRSSVGKSAYGGYEDWVESNKAITYSRSSFNQLPNSSTVTKQDVIDNINYVDEYADAGTTNLNEVFETIGNSIKELAQQNLNYAITNEQVSNTSSSDTPLTYVDPIGEYMMVKQINSVKLFGKTFKVKNGSGYEVKSTNDQYAYSHITPYYVVDGDSQDIELINDFGHKTNINEDLEIYVKTDYNLDAQGNYADFAQELVVKADKEAIGALILRLTYTTDNDDNMLVNASGANFNANDIADGTSSPLQVDYTVGLIDAVYEQGLEAVSDEYVEKHLDKDTNKVSFYSNAFTGKNVCPENKQLGDAYVTFYAAETNGFYYIVDDYFENYYDIDTDAYYIYSDVNGANSWTGSGTVKYTPYTTDLTLTKLTTKSLNDNTPVYALVTRTQLVADGSGGYKIELLTYVRQFPWLDVKDCVVKKAGTNNYILEAPHLRHGQFLDTAILKTNNVTKTSKVVKEVLNSEDQDHDHQIISYLGNNGLLTIDYTTQVDVEKVWDDNNNQDGLRPETIVVNLLANGEKVKEAIVSADDNWMYTFENLPVYVGGEKMTYTLEEQVVEGYTSTIDGYKITNKHVPEVITIAGEKTWNDDDNRDALRPSSILVRLLADNQEVMHAVVSEESGWKYTFNDLPKYANGNEINYTLTEDPVKGYTTTYNGYNVINTHTPETVEVSVEKVWDDGNNQDGIRPSEITVELFADGQKVKSATLKESDNWKYTFKDLPKNTHGVAIQYTINEISVDGYKTSVNGNIITNTYTPKTTEITVNKQWVDNNDRYGLRPELVNINLFANGEKVAKATMKESENWTYTFENLPLNKNGKAIKYTISEDEVEGYKSSIDGYTIKNTLETTKISVSKVWDDNNDQDGLRPETITVTLNAHIHVDDKKQDVDLDLTSDAKTISVKMSESHHWQYTFDDLPNSIDGHVIVYSISEKAVENYATYVTGNANDGFVITNSRETDTTNIPVRKVWDDKNNQDGIRPHAVTIRLYDGQKELNSVELNEGNNWSYVFETDALGNSLPRNRDGKKIAYTISEDKVDDRYTTYIDQDTHTVTNVYVPETTSVTVSKTWVDENNRYNTRPESIIVRLLADGIQVDEKVLDSSGDWKHTFANLPKKANGKTIAYTVKEDTVEGYVTKIDGYKITNTLETRDLTITKVWVDNNNQDGLRPQEITVRLYADGVEKTAVKLNEKNNWTYEFKGIPKYTNEDGTIEVVYTIREDSVEGYTTEIDGYEITNTHIPSTTQITVNKLWDDNNNQDGIRPTAIQVNLLANGTVVKTTNVSVDLEGNWTYTFTNLPKYENGKEITYSVSEEKVDGYVTSIDGYTMTNKHVPEVTEIKVNKVWNDGNNQDGLRPKEIKVHLYANEAMINTVVLNEGNHWTYTFHTDENGLELPKYKDGKAIVYTVNEEEVEGYVTSIDGYIITNTHVPEETYVRVNKVWNDNDNQDGIRPSTITVSLYADGTFVEKATVSADKHWVHVFANLPKYDNGKEINYTVKEISQVPGYTSVINGHTITNSHKPATKELTVTKVWVDNNDQDGLRPNELTVYLYADNELVKTVKLSEASNWKYTFTNLPVYENGRAIDYTIGEELVVGYEKDINNDSYILTNTHAAEMTQVSVTKQWDDEDNVDNYRPDSIIVTLDGHVHVDGSRINVDLDLASDATTLTTTMNEAGSWTYTFDNLPVYYEGHKIVYNVTETPVAHYDTYVTGDAEKGFTITNTRESDKISIPVRKVWDDHDDQDGIRPDSVTINLLANGEKVDSVVLSEANRWAHTFVDMQKNDAQGAITYTIQEEQTDDRYTPIYDQKTHTVTNVYTPETTSVTVNKTWTNENDKFDTRPESITVRLYSDGVEVAVASVDETTNWQHTFHHLPKKNNGKDIVYTISEDPVEGYKTTIDGYNMTNTLETTKVTVNKQWDDNNNQDGIRPEEITVHLHANGEIVETAVVKATDNWQYTFDGLPKLINGKQVIYTLSETPVEGYETKVNGNTITNTHIPETTELTVNKVWDDNNNQDGIRPKQITVHLYADGEIVETVIIDATDWAHTFTNLPVYKEGTKITYTVSEEAVEGYTTTVDGFVITNKHEVEKVNINVVKVWDDKDDKDKLRPESITVHLCANGVVYKSVTITEADGWKYEFIDLDKYQEGNLIIYTFAEDSVPGYTTTIDGNIITNTHKVKVVETGDSSDMTLWLSAMFISLFGMVFIQRKRKEEY